jgi:hypothetical protein
MEYLQSNEPHHPNRERILNLCNRPILQGAAGDVEVLAKVHILRMPGKQQPSKFCLWLSTLAP